VTPVGSGTLSVVATVMILYMGALLVIAWRAARRTHGGDDFHLAGRSLGAWAAGISSTASSESGWVTLGAVGMTYVHGVSGLWYAPGCLLGYLVNLWLVAPRLRRMSREQGSVTLTDVLTSRWGDPRQVVRLTATTIILVAMMGYVAAQMTAAGKAFSSIFPFEGRAGYLLGVVIGAVVITLVTSLGGFRAVAWTDLFQGLLMAGALLALPLWAILHLVGGFGALIDGLGAADPSFLTATGDRIGPAMWGFVIGELGIGLGYPGMPHVVTRYMATRSEGEIRRLRVIALLWGVAVFYGAGLVGLAGRVLMPGLQDGEQTLMALALRFTHPVIAGLLLAAAAVSYDLVEKMLGRSADDRRSLVLGRWTVAVVGALGILVALSGVRLVFWFVLFAWSALGASFGPLVLLAVTGDRVNRHGALAGMLTGAGVTVAWKLGRDIAANPDAFAAVPWAVLGLAGVLLAAAALARRLGRGEATAIVVAAAVTLASWWLVQRGGLDNLYELVPAFFCAGAAALAVSRMATTSEGEKEPQRH